MRTSKKRVRELYKQAGEALSCHWKEVPARVRAAEKAADDYLKAYSVGGVQISPYRNDNWFISGLVSVENGVALWYSHPFDFSDIDTSLNGFLDELADELQREAACA